MAYDIIKVITIQKKMDLTEKKKREKKRLKQKGQFNIIRCKTSNINLIPGQTKFLLGRKSKRTISLD